MKQKSEPMGYIAHKMSGILELPIIYELFQSILGVGDSRKRFIEEFVRPSPDARILDIGCGPGTILDYLPNTVEYVGYDLNPRYIASAQKKYGNRANFFCAQVKDFSLHPSLEKFDIVLARGIVHHINDDEAAKLFRDAYFYLSQNGVLVTIDCAYVSHQSAIIKWLISKDRGKHVRTPQEYTKLASKQFSSVETITIENMSRLPYTHVVMRLTRR